MALEDLSTGKKKAIVIIALLIIISLKIYGFIQTKPTIALIIALGIISAITDATPVSGGELPPGYTATGG